MKMRLFLTGLFLLAIFKVNSQVAELGGNKVNASASIFHNLSKSGDHTVLTAGVRAAGLENLLSGKGNYTLFAPVSNAIIHEIPAGRAEQLFNELLPEQQPEMYEIIAYHIVPEQLSFAGLSERVKAGKGSATLTTLNGRKLVVSQPEEDTIILTDNYGRKSVVIQQDIRQSNGFIHVVSQAMLPQGALKVRDYQWDCK